MTTSKPLPVDEDGCHTLPNGECVSPGPCPHTPGFYDKPEAKGWQWWWATTMARDDTHHGPFDSQALALIDAQNESKQASVIVFEGKRQTLSNDCFHADLVIAASHELNEEMANPNDGGLNMNPTSTQKMELEEALEGVLAAWRQKHDLGRAYTLDTRVEITVALNTNRGDLT